VADVDESVPGFCRKLLNVQTCHWFTPHSLLLYSWGIEPTPQN
jgi:hypothetical protein